MKQRGEVMRRYAEALRKRADRLKELAILEAGCPVSSTVMGAQVHAPLRMTDEIIDMFLTPARAARRTRCRCTSG